MNAPKDYANWLRSNAERRLEAERFEMGGLGSALVSTSEVDNLRAAADTIDSLSSKLEQSQLEIARLEAQHSQGLREDEKRERAHELALAALANRDARIAEQNETIRQLNEAVELWMERAGRGAP